VVYKAVKLSGRGGGLQGSDAARLLTKICQNVIFVVMSEVQKDLEDISSEI
jgi:hypothetical protein